MLALGAEMGISSVQLEGDRDCLIVIRKPGMGTKIEVRPPQEQKIAITGQFFTVTLQRGVLRKLKLSGMEAIQLPCAVGEEAKKVPTPPKLSAKLIQIPAKRQIVLDVGKPKKMKGLVFRDMIGVRSIILAFFAGKWDNPQEKPVATDYYYIPEGDSRFVLRFKAFVTARFLQIHFYDVSGGFTEPKVTLFSV
jgi:hypothetical protein